MLAVTCSLNMTYSKLYYPNYPQYKYEIAAAGFQLVFVNFKKDPGCTPPAVMTMNAMGDNPADNQSTLSPGSFSLQGQGSSPKDGFSDNIKLALILSITGVILTGIICFGVNYMLKRPNNARKLTPR